jgi:hypothetical protein
MTDGRFDVKQRNFKMNFQTSYIISIGLYPQFMDLLRARMACYVMQLWMLFDKTIWQI